MPIRTNAKKIASDNVKIPMKNESLAHSSLVRRSRSRRLEPKVQWQKVSRLYSSYKSRNVKIKRIFYPSNNQIRYGRLKSLMCTHVEIEFNSFTFTYSDHHWLICQMPLMDRKARTTTLYNRILEYEQRMDELRFDLPMSIRSGDHNRAIWLECRCHLRMGFEELFVVDGEFVEGGELLAAFWHRLYYAPVEQARKELGNVTGMDNGAGIMRIIGGGGNVEEWEAMRNDIISIIDEGIGFFSMLVYQSKLALAQSSNDKSILNVAPLKRNISGAMGVDTAKRLLYECLIYLGDLARYRNSLECGGLEIAEGYYHEASVLLPSYGHAFNQLAVLCCWQERMLEAVLYYLRAAMSTKGFPKSAGNLLILCRRIVNVMDNRLALSNDPSLSVLFGLLVRLVATVIVHELTRNSHFPHLGSIAAGLSSLLDSSRTNIFNTATELDGEVLVLIFAMLILSIEFLQKSSARGSAAEKYLCPGQCRLLKWILLLSEKHISCPGKIKFWSRQALSLLCLWIADSDLVARIERTDFAEIDQQETMELFHSLIRAIANVASENAADDTEIDSSFELLLSGTRTMPAVFSVTSKSFFLEILHNVVMHLSQRHPLLVFDESTKRYELRQDVGLAKRGKMMMDLPARQRSLANSSECGDQSETPLPKWHICDAEGLLRNWDRIERLLKVGAIKLLITGSTLRYLDHVKNENSKARQLMKAISNLYQQKNPNVHLEHLRDRDLPMLPPSANKLPIHLRALLSAYFYFDNPIRDFAPICLMTDDPAMISTLELLSIPFVSVMAQYLARL